jgi:hypothetical protein
VAGPLLVYRARQSPELLFAAAGLAADQRRELGRLVQELLTRLGRVGDEDWVGEALRRMGRRDLGDAVLALDSKRMIAGFTVLRSVFQKAFRQAPSVNSPAPDVIDEMG